MEEIKELTPEEKEEKYLARIQELENTVNNTVEEIKEMRKKAAEKKPEETPKENLGTTPNIKEEIDKSIKSIQDATISKNKERAIKRLYEDYKEFNPENDPTGLKRKEFEKNLERINTTGLVETEDFTEAFEFTIKGMGIDTSKKDNKVYPYASNSKDNGGQPKSNESEEVKLTESETAYANGMGIPLEKFKESLKKIRNK